jgi:hypothetical protein
MHSQVILPGRRWNRHWPSPLFWLRFGSDQPGRTRSDEHEISETLGGGSLPRPRRQLLLRQRIDELRGYIVFESKLYEEPL